MPHYQTRDPWAAPQITPYAFLEVLERDDGFDDNHGAQRLAILFLGADGHATYDALFCQGNGAKPPFAVLIQDHGFGGNYSEFGKGGVMERIALETYTLPEWLVVGSNSKAWDGYAKVPEVDSDRGGMHGDERFLYSKQPLAQ